MVLPRQSEVALNAALRRIDLRISKRVVVRTPNGIARLVCCPDRCTQVIMVVVGIDALANWIARLIALARCYHLRLDRQIARGEHAHWAAGCTAC